MAPLNNGMTRTTSEKIQRKATEFISTDFLCCIVWTTRHFLETKALHDTFVQHIRHVALPYWHIDFVQRDTADRKLCIRIAKPVDWIVRLVGLIRAFKRLQPKKWVYFKTLRYVFVDNEWNQNTRATVRQHYAQRTARYTTLGWQLVNPYINLWSDLR